MGVMAFTPRVTGFSRQRQIVDLRKQQIEWGDCSAALRSTRCIAPIPHRIGISPSMTLEDFLQHSAGDWLSQKTNHDVADSRYASGRSTISVEVLSASSPDLVTVCQQQHIDPATAAGGLKYVWTGRLDGDESDRTETTLYIFLPGEETSEAGKLVRTSTSVGQPSRFSQSSPSSSSSTSTGQYSLGSDDALTMNASSDAGASKERIWFASENLRIRSTIVETADGFSAASLSSDIRKLSSKPAA